MRGVDPIEFGRRVAALRTERDLSQAELGTECGYSQQTIANIEKGAPKRPQRNAIDLAAALRTTTEYLCYGTGPKHVGPRFLTPKKLVDSYHEMTDEDKEALSDWIAERRHKGKKRKAF